MTFIDRSAMCAASRHLNLDLDIDGLLHRAALPDGAAVFLTSDHRPHPFLHRFAVHMAATLEPLSIRQYAYTALRFANLLEQQGVSLDAVTEHDLAWYRRERLSAGLAPSSWRTEALVVRRLLDYLVATGGLPKRPWIEVGQRSVLTAPIKANADVRHLDLAQWRAFRDIGLGGRLPSGGLDPTFRGEEASRNVAGAELAIGTGMRRTEFSTVLLPEVASGEFVIEACAKLGKPRDVCVPDRTAEYVWQYVRGHRKSLVYHQQPFYRRIENDLIVGDEDDARQGFVRIDRKKIDLRRLPPGVRRKLFVRNEIGLEPLAVFLGRGGLMIGTSTWNRTFRDASRRVSRFPDAAQVAGGVSPHDLRHTYAVRLMGYLVRHATDAYAQRLADGGDPQQTIGEAVSINPLLSVQKMLGHASPSTTAVYLRYIEDLRALVERMLDEWDAEGEIGLPQDARW
ncbi:tyrosine-type recombinase/integrase [Flexivirga meconopsidis]|uniref:tyrosine-type recombinase/integrase n=1 Tax=Flexivirga meconopsidis TaxID=2977121 RepID=UPI00223EEBCD|nr:site-specific integrase [Flexivirga meconopsidis]